MQEGHFLKSVLFDDFASSKKATSHKVQFPQCGNITFLEVVFFDFRNMSVAAGKLHVTKSILFFVMV